ncbi:MAG: gamma-butyrobetaine hydroxylase-like domain-containing protein [Hyphomicrobiales bacterium]
MTETKNWPTEIRISDAGSVLNISFDDGQNFALSAEYLRVESPSAEVKGHGKGQEVTVPGKRNVRIIGAEPVGNYAVRLKFDDMHDTGIFSWTYLAKLGREHSEIWDAYLQKLEAEGKSRD